MLSICVTIKNRSMVKTDRGVLPLFPDFISSLKTCLPLKESVELIVTDWESDDYPLNGWLPNALEDCDIDLHLITLKNGRFSRGKGLNIAAEHANGDILFFMDADLIVNRQVLHFALDMCKDKSAYYPIVKYQTDFQSSNVMYHPGGGIVAMNKQVFLDVGMWPELYKHGFEDTLLHDKLDGKFKIWVSPSIDIFHQWHPMTKEFKNLHYTPNQQEESQYRAVEEHYRRLANKDTEKIKKQVVSIINDPNTTHSKLNPVVKGYNKLIGR